MACTRSFRSWIQLARYVSLYAALRVERDRTASHDTLEKHAPVKSRSWDVLFVWPLLVSTLVCGYALSTSCLTAGLSEHNSR